MKLFLYLMALMWLGTAPAMAGSSVLECLKRSSDLFSKSVRLYSGNLTTGLDQRSFALFEKARLDPSWEISQEDQEWLKKQGLSKTFGTYASTAVIFRDLNHLIALNKRNRPLSWSTKGWLQKVERYGSDILNAYGLPIGPKKRAQRIFWKVAETGYSKLSSSDLAFVKSWGLEPEISRFTDEVSNNRQGFLVMGQIQKAGSGLRWSVMGSTVVGATLLEYIGHKDLSAAQAFDQNNAEGVQAAGNVEIILPVSSRYPSVVVVDGSAVIFSNNRVTLEPAGRTEILDRIKEERIEHFRIRLKANNSQIADLKQKLISYLSIKDSNSSKYYLNDSNSEILKVLRQEFKLPPMWVADHFESLVNYFKIVQATQGPLGEVADIYRVEHSPKPITGEVEEAAQHLLSSYNWINFLMSMPLVADFGVATFDSQSSSIIELRKK